jgi:hypothetical protein
MSKLLEPVFWIGGVIIFLVWALPAIAGYGYAVLMLPAYDQTASCEKEKADPIRADDYRVYLLNHGCTVEAALQGIGKDLSVNPARLMAFYKGETRPASADEVSAWDAALAMLRTFKLSPAGSGDGLSSFWGDDAISRQFERLGERYTLTATPIFLSALDLGASHIAGIMQQGKAAEGGLYIAYLIGLAILATALYDLLKRLFT